MYAMYRNKSIKFRVIFATSANKSAFPGLGVENIAMYANNSSTPRGSFGFFWEKHALPPLIPLWKRTTRVKSNDLLGAFHPIFHVVINLKLWFHEHQKWYQLNRPQLDHTFYCCIELLLVLHPIPPLWIIWSCDFTNIKSDTSSTDHSLISCILGMLI